MDSGPGQPFDSPPRTGTSLAHRCKNFRFRGVTATLLAVIWACLTLPTESVPQLTFLTWPAPTIVNKPLYIHALVKDDIKTDLAYRVGQELNGFKLISISWKYVANSSSIQSTTRDPHLVVLGTCPPVVTNIMSSVTYQALGGTVVTTTISVTAITTVPQTSPLKVVLPLGNTFTLLHGQTNTISVLGLDPDDVDAPESSITYAWQCVFVDSSPCLLGSGSPFPLPATSSRSFTVAASQAVQAKIHKISVTLSKPGKAPLTVQLTVDFDKLAVLPVAPGVWGNSGQKGGWIKEDDVYVLQACSDGRDGTICKLGGPQLGLQVTTRAFAAGKLLQTWYNWTLSGPMELQGIDLGSKRTVMVPNIYNRTLSSIPQLCVLASNQFDGASKSGCIRLIPHQAVSLQLKLSNERLIDGADLDPTTGLTVWIKNFINGGQAQGVDPRIGVYEFAFGFCTHFRKNECQGSLLFQEWGLQESTTLTLPFIKLSKGFSVAVAVKVRDTTGTEQTFFKKILVRYPRSSAQEVLSKLDKTSLKTYFFQLSTVFFSFPGASLTQACQELSATAQASFSSLLGRHSVESLLTCLTLCLHKSNLTSESTKAIKDLTGSIWNQKGQTPATIQGIASRRSLEVYEYRDFDKVVVSKSLALLLYQAEYLLANTNNKASDPELKQGLLGLVAPHIKREGVVKGSLETFGFIGRLYYHLEPQGLLETNLVLKDLYPGGFSTSKLDFLDALNYTQTDSLSLLDGEFLVIYDSYYLPRSRVTSGNKTTAMLNSSVYASFQIYNSSLQTMNLNNLTNSFSVLLPTDSLDLFREQGWQEVCQRGIAAGGGVSWSLHGTSDLYIVDKIEQESVPACSSDVFGDFKLISDSVEAPGAKALSLRQLFYLYWPVYAEITFIVGCLLVFASIYFREKNGLHKKSDYLRSLNKSLAGFDLRGMQSCLEGRSTSHRRVFNGLKDLLAEENNKLMNIYGKLEAIGLKKTKIVYRNAGAELEELERQKMEKLRLEHGLDSEGEEIGEDREGKDDAKMLAEDLEGDTENATFYDYKAKKGRDLKEEIGTEIKQSHIEKANRQFISYKVLDEGTASPKKTRLKGLVMGKKKLEVKTNASKAALLFNKRQYYKDGIDSIDEQPEQEDDNPGVPNIVSINGNLIPPEWPKNTESVSTVGGPDSLTPTRSEDPSIVKQKGHSQPSEAKISQFVIPSEQKKPAAPVSLIDTKKLREPIKGSPQLHQANPQDSEKDVPADITAHTNKERSFKSEFVSFTDLFLISHRLTGIFMFKDPFNLTALRFMLTFNLMLCMFVLCGAISLYTIDTFPEPKFNFYLAVTVWPIPALILANLKSELMDSCMLVRMPFMVYHYFVSLLRLKKIDDAFLKRYMQIPRWKNLVKLLVVVVEMFCYIICVAYIFVTATLAHNRYILLAFSVALVFQFMFIDNFRIFWKIQSSLGYINVLKSLEGELKKERDGTTPLVEIVTQEQKKDTSSRRMLLRSGDLSAAQQKLFQAERRLDYTLLAYLSFYCPVNQ